MQKTKLATDKVSNKQQARQAASKTNNERVWQQARQMADEKFSNPNSREYKRKKITHTPVDLVVYVGNKSLTKIIKRKIV